MTSPLLLKLSLSFKFCFTYRFPVQQRRPCKKMVNVEHKLQVWVGGGGINSAAYNFYFLFAICQEGVTTWLKQQQQMVEETLTLGELDVIREVKKELKRIKIELIKVEIQTYLLDKRTEEAEKIKQETCKRCRKVEKKKFYSKTYFT